MRTSTRPNPQSLLVGIATADVTPPIGICLTGYNPRFATKVGHRTRSEVLVCRSGDTSWAWVAVECLSFSQRFTRELRTAIARKTDIPADHVLLSATHTHSGPHFPRDGFSYPISRLERAYEKKLLRTLLATVVKAEANAKPGSFEATTINAPKWGHNRRVKGADGTWTNDWRDPKLQHTGYFDASVAVVGVRRPNGKLDALLVNYGSHPVTLGPRSKAISGDFVSYMKDALEGKRGVRTVMFGVSGHANINPPVCVQRFKRVPVAMGKALAKQIRSALPRLKPLRGSHVDAAIVPWKVRGSGGGVANRGFRPVRRNGMTHSEVMAVGAGDLGIVGVPGELFSEFVRQFRSTSPFASTLVLSLANDYIGYFPTDKALKQGAYEARMSPGPKVERPLKHVVHTALKRCRVA